MRPFICPYCSKSHTQGDNLKIHIRKVHPEYPVPTVDELREMMFNAYNSPALYSALTVSSATAAAPPALDPPVSPPRSETPTVTLDSDN